jgi:predicted AAA+ superfamily ATPase
MTTQELEKSIQEIWSLFKETDKKFKETDKEIDKLGKSVEETRKTSENTNKAVYALTGKWSRFVEGLIAPAVERLFKERGIDVDKVFQRVKTHRNGDEMEVDILAINGEYAVLIEAKSTLKIEDVKEHLERLEKFKTFFPEYSKRKVVGAVGGIVIEEDSDKYAYRNGLFAIGESGDTAVILNDKGFEPKVW